MPEYRLSILHISDLHARSTDVSELPEAAREGRLRQIHREARSRNEVLGERWDENLRELYPSGERPDLVCFTGDVADWGLRSEYTEATKLVDRIIDVLGVERSRVYVVPGNHDVRRTNPKRKEDRKAHRQWETLRTVVESDPLATSNWLAGGPAPRAMKDAVRETVTGRTTAFWHWVEHGLRRPELLPTRNRHGRLGYHHVPELPHLPFPVHVVGLDSAWLAGDDHDQGKLWLTQHQRDMLLFAPDGSLWEDGFRLALIHHPIHELAQPEHEPTWSALARSVDLLLHGHQHDPVGTTHVDVDGRVIRVLAAGCLFEGAQGSRYENGCHRIDVALNGAGKPLRAEIHFRAWSKRGHWHSDSSLYRNAKDGRLVWHAWGRDGDAPPSTQRIDNLGDRPPIFEGRDGELARIRDGLAGGGAAAVFSAVVGLGGVGKSRLALEYAFVGDYDVRWWVRASGVASLHEDLVRLGRRLGVLGEVVESVERAVDEVLDWLSTHERWLLVLDDAEGPDALLDALRGRLSRLSSGHVLITSRAQAWRSLARPIEITTLSPEAAKAVLLERSRQQDDGDADAVAKQLGYLPLALVQAGAYVEATGCSLHEYLGLLEQHGIGVFLEPDAAAGFDYESTVAATWGISLAAIQGEDPAAAALLNWLAFLDPDGVPLRLLRERADLLPKEVADCVGSSLALNRAIAVLRRYSMVDRVEQPEDALRVHRLVQAVTRDELGDERRSELAAAVVTWVTSVFAYEPDATLIRDVPEGIGEQVMATGMLEICAVASGYTFAQVLNALGEYHARRGMLSAARVAFQRSLKLAERLTETSTGGSQNQRALSVVLSALGDIELEGGNLTLAHSFHRRSLEVAERLASTEPHDVLAQHNLCASLIRLGDIEMRTGSIGAARNLFRQCVDILGALPTTGSHGSKIQHAFSISLLKLGEVEVQAGDMQTAQKLFLRSVRSLESLVVAKPRDHRILRNLAVALSKLAETEVHFSRLMAARNAFQRITHVLQGLTDMDPQNAKAKHDLAHSLDRLGNMEMQASNFEAARAIWKRALALREALSRENPQSVRAQQDLCISLTKLGEVEVQLRRVPEARDYYQRSLDLREMLVAKKPQDTRARRALTISLEKLVEVELLARNFTAARGHGQRCLQLREVLSTADPLNSQATRDLAVALDRLGCVELQAENFTVALGHFQRSHELRRMRARRDPNDSEAAFDIAVALFRLASLSRAKQDKEAFRAAVTAGVEHLASMQATGQISGFREREGVQQFFRSWAQELAGD